MESMMEEEEDAIDVSATDVDDDDDGNDDVYRGGMCWYDLVSTGVIQGGIITSVSQPFLLDVSIFGPPGACINLLSASSDVDGTLLRPAQEPQITLWELNLLSTSSDVDRTLLLPAQEPQITLWELIREPCASHMGECVDNDDEADKGLLCVDDDDEVDVDADVVSDTKAFTDNESDKVSGHGLTDIGNASLGLPVTTS
jgi:hypothetical protein